MAFDLKTFVGIGDGGQWDDHPQPYVCVDDAIHAGEGWLNAGSIDAFKVYAGGTKLVYCSSWGWFPKADDDAIELFGSVGPDPDDPTDYDQWQGYEKYMEAFDPTYKKDFGV
jgi:hypothetical protein